MNRQDRSLNLLLLSGAILALTGCGQEQKAEAPAPRPVRAITAEEQIAGDAIVLTGHIAAEDEAGLGFRINGRMLTRPVNVGDRVVAGQVLATLDRANEENALRSARATLAAAQASLTQTRAAFERQRTLLSQGWATRANFDKAEKAYLTSQAQVTDGQVQVRIAEDNLSYTELTADAPGTVTARGAEPGEVVQAGQMIVRIARQNGRDAVFDVPTPELHSVASAAVIAVTLTADPSVTAAGRVREMSPQADPVTRTFEVKVGLADPPEAMRLGSTVNGSVSRETAPVMVIPASALTEANRQPAVWVVDPQTNTVSLRPVELERHDPDSVVISSGLANGDVVVTAGVQALHPGQKVRLLGSAA